MDHTQKIPESQLPYERLPAGCGGLAEDSIEHYSRCRAVRAVADVYLRLGRNFTVDMEHFVLASEDLKCDDSLSCVAVLVYAAYNATNLLRAKDKGPVLMNVAHELLKQFCRSAVMGHSSRTNVIDGRWCTRSATRRRIA